MLQGVSGVHLQVQTLSCIVLISYQNQNYVLLFSIKDCWDSDLQP